MSERRGPAAGEKGGAMSDLTHRERIRLTAKVKAAG
jgi:hypothetical protein